MLEMFYVRDEYSLMCLVPTPSKSGGHATEPKLHEVNISRQTLRKKATQPVSLSCLLFAALSFSLALHFCQNKMP